MEMNSCVWIFVAVTILCCPAVVSTSNKLALRMPGAKPTKPDEYLCVAKRLPDNVAIVGFEPSADQRQVHHMLVLTCSRPASTRRIWRCNGMGAVCAGTQPANTIFAWGKDAPGVTFPPGVGMIVNSHARYAVAQLHYTDVKAIPEKGDHSGVSILLSKHRPRYLASIYVFAGEDVLPPGRPDYNVDLKCRFIGRANLHPFAFRTHAHNHATQISAFVRRPHSSTWTLIGTQSPQRPQAFYPVPNKSIVIHPNDYLAARCQYNTTGEEDDVLFGATRKDEMCNFYMMFYTSNKANINEDYEGCYSSARGSLTKSLPHPPLPPFNGSLHHHHHKGSQAASKAVPAMHASRLKMMPWPKGSSPGRVSNVVLGQVGGVAVDSKGRVVVFHRGPRTWNVRSFDYGHVFQERDSGPISVETVLVLDNVTGEVVESWGKDLFYLPHGITVDHQGDVWLTDVAMHQVFKFVRGHWTKPAVTLGVAFKPGAGLRHFCQPADVVVNRKGHVFVADGYCNQRIMKFSSSGKLLMYWHAAGHGSRRKTYQGIDFHVVHSLTLSPTGRLCVADRENSRILCYSSESGHLLGAFSAKKFGRSLYAVAFGKNGYMYAVNGKQRIVPSLGFTIKIGASLKSFRIVGEWAANVSGKLKFSRPHAMAVGPDGSVYVGEIGPNRLWKFSDPGMQNLDVHHSPAVKPTVPTQLTSNVNALSSSLPILPDVPHIKSATASSAGSVRNNALTSAAVTTRRRTDSFSTAMTTPAQEMDAPTTAVFTTPRHVGTVKKAHTSSTAVPVVVSKTDGVSTTPSETGSQFPADAEHMAHWPQTPMPTRIVQGTSGHSRSSFGHVPTATVELINFDNLDFDELVTVKTETHHHTTVRPHHKNKFPSLASSSTSTKQSPGLSSTILTTPSVVSRRQGDAGSTANVPDLSVDLPDPRDEKSEKRPSGGKHRDWTQSLSNDTVIAAVTIVAALFAGLICSVVVKLIRSSRGSVASKARRKFTRHRGTNVEFQRLDGSPQASDSDQF